MFLPVQQNAQPVGRMAPKHYDAVLLASFGGPEGQDDVIPFLRNVTRGRGIPDERLEEVATHYRAHGGVSPINAQNRELRAALQQELENRGLELPVWLANRNWLPYFPETLQDMYDAGHRRILMVTTGAYAGYSSCRQYREDLAMALRSTGLEGKLEVDKVRQYFDHPGFVAPFEEGLAAGLRDVVEQVRNRGVDPTGRVTVLFSTHSVPTADALAAGPRSVAEQMVSSPRDADSPPNVYSAQHLAVAERIMERLDPADVGLTAAPAWRLVYQSRSGAPHIPWLEPDINDAIDALAADGGTQGVVVVPLGFISDHMEVIWDLDTEAKATAEGHQLAFIRTPTPGTNPAFVAGLADLICERHGAQCPSARRAETSFGPWYDVCRADCCVKTMRDGTRRPTIAGEDSTVCSELVNS